MTTRKRAAAAAPPAAEPLGEPTAEAAGPADGAPAEAVTGTADEAGSAEEADEADGESADFVTFVVEGETYAFPMARVEEIIRVPSTVRVPLGPPSLTGLANLRGRVLPVVSLRACCGLPAADDDDATRVVVVDGGATLGFVVDRVSSVASVDPARVEPVDAIRSAVDTDLLSGVIRPDGDAGDDEGRLVKVLDVERLVAGQFAALQGSGVAVRGRPGAGAAGAPAARGTDAGAGGGGHDGADDEDDDTVELVSFAVDGQEYALPIDRVQEIVRAPEQVTRVPNAAARVLGLMDLRGGLLPVIGLREVFGLVPAALTPQHRIVVVQLPRDGAGDGGHLVGVVTDTVREVLRVPAGVVTPLPEYVVRAGSAREVDTVCRLEDGRRLVSVLSVERMFADEGVRAALRAAGGDASTDPGEEEGTAMAAAADGTAAGGSEETDDELLVVFRLGTEEYAVDVDRVQEIIRVPESLIRVPRTPDFVEGLVNLRGAVLPVVDLRTRLGLPRPERDERQRIVVLTVGGIRTGFVVDAVAEVLPVGRTALEPAPEMSDEQARVVTRVANLTGAGRMLLLLETEELLAGEQLAALVPHQREAAEDALPVA